MEIREIFKCDICGNVVELVQAGAPALVCCGEDMKKLEAQTEDSSVEKHVPVVKENEGGIEVVVGSTLHPMEADHLIKFIEVLTEDKVLRAELESGEEPKASFNIDKSKVIEVREFCNVHGLWKA
ncbi:desulfoferrodoxin [Sporohalobacter salinus]|uniref:desulfoferrodoxin n=1 Tax=Sporohalobacter salinus TaxID=1494606 RepID=UPI0019603B6D|nr:desulfoferrodoxin [Sporohalobacter salinus]MBM7623798.1 superoxide reductase [Sporohalobacter salinus]